MQASKRQTHIEKSLRVLMKDYGYRMDGPSLVSVGIRGFTSDRIVRQFRSTFAAAEYLIWLVGDADYSARFRKITTPRD